MRRQTPAFDSKAAEFLAIEALSFLAEEAERLGRFLALTGISPAEIRSQAHAPRFLAAVLDYIAGDESLLLDFAGRTGRDPSEVGRARLRLGGPAWEADTA
ncbi:MAG TPA: DUF3572 domain-containing protein [Xanthobacteraceae bacterium]|nr:DUF3572 domain-containing protein [Xanthobacteraceae bacterium]